MSLNLADCLVLSAEAEPEKTALVFDDARLSYAEVAAGMRRVAWALRERGIGRGDRIAFLLPNVPQFVISYYGTLYLGATCVTLNPTLRARELKYYLQHSGARAVFVWYECAGEAKKVLELLDEPPLLIVVEPGMKPQTPDVGESFMSLLLNAEDGLEMAATAPEDTAVILYTSALEGIPRGAELSHFNLFQNALVIREFTLKYFPDDVCLAVLPLFHGFGQTTMMNAALLSRSTIVLMPKFETGKIFDTIARERITLLAMVPTMFHLLLSYKPNETFDISSLRATITGGAKMPRDLAQGFKDRFGMTVLEGYGLTETSPVVAFNINAETNRPGSVGKPIWGCRVVVRREDGSRAAAGEVGEVVVSGPNVMKGYWRDPETTAATIQNGWLRTGDLGYLDEDGYLFLTALKKDMLIRAGMNVYPREIEQVLEEHPDIREAAVIGVPDTLRGQEVQAFVVLKNCKTPSEKELTGYCRERLASYKCPKHFQIIDTLPRLDDGRVAKERLLALVD